MPGYGSAFGRGLLLGAGAALAFTAANAATTYDGNGQVPQQFVLSGKAADRLHDHISINADTAEKLSKACEAIARPPAHGSLTPRARESDSSKQASAAVRSPRAAASSPRARRPSAADPKRSILSGASWGGYLTLLGLGPQPERWSAGIGIVPIGDYVAAFEDEMEPLKRYDAALFGGTPAEIPDVYRKANPITYVDKVKAPLLVTVGQNDPRCPARSVDLYTARLRELGTPYEEYRYDAGHGSVVVAEQIKQLAMQLDFAAKHLGTTRAIA